MTLADIIYNYFNTYIFKTNSTSSGLYVFFGNTYVSVFGQNFGIATYLSLICTIISLVVILILCCMFIKKIYNMCAHIIG